MRSRSLGRTLTIPLSTAIVITIILFFAPNITLPTGGRLDQSFARQLQRLPSTSIRPTPWTMVDDQRARGDKPAPAAIPQRLGASSQTNYASSLNFAIRPPMPRMPTAHATLLAPVMIKDTELAGLFPSSLLTHDRTRMAASQSGKKDEFDGAEEPMDLANTQLLLSRRSLSRRGPRWPDTPELDERLQGLMNETICREWATSALELLNKLRSLPQVNHPDSATLLDQMATQAQQGLESAEASKEQWPSRAAWLRAAYSLQRRAEVWKAVLASQSLDPYRLTTGSRAKNFEVASLVREVRTATRETGDETGWSRFLLLNEIEQAAAKPHFAKRQVIAQRFLSRLDGVRLTTEQKAWIANQPVQRLSVALRPWAAEPISLFDLLEQIEIYEATPDHLAAAQLAQAIQSLRHSDQPELVEVAAQLNDHYRNANLRVAITPSMLERLLPDPPAKVSPVEQQILGATVRGQSVTTTRLGIQLIPQYEAWKIQFRAHGDVQTNTVSKKGATTLTNSGSLEFQATTTIQVSNDGVRIDSPQVTVESQGNHLQSVASDFDTIPIVGSMVRAMIVSGYHSQQGRADAIARKSAEQQIAQHLDQEIRAAAAKGEQQAMQRLFGPLAALDLNPLVIDLQTTEERLQVRYRVAGDYQLAANSPRPRAWSNSVCSLQVHQSTINNLLEQTLVAEEPLPLQELWRRALGPFGVEEPEGLREQVLLQFAPTCPVMVRFDQGLVEMNLRIALLVLDDRVFRDFVVRVDYRPQFEGLTARLVREGTVSIQGQNLSTRDRLPIRVIFSKVFSEHRKPYLVHPSVAEDPRLADLMINQLETRDGWVAIALAPIGSVPKIARLP